MVFKVLHVFVFVVFCFFGFPLICLHRLTWLPLPKLSQNGCTLKGKPEEMGALKKNIACTHGFFHCNLYSNENDWFSYLNRID